mmetsp:Transcript_76922/g.249166  ORF Transcript_76922/g.249166 Transcript_76922/m.249166 type:complete len:396 (-) Transcript_76922:138-1325(-)
MRILRPRTLRFRTSRHLRRSKFSQSSCSTSRPKATLQRSLSARFARSFSSGANPSSLGALTCSVGIASPSGAQCSRAASLGLDAPRVQDRCLVLCARSRSEAKTTSMKSALEARAAVVFSGRCCPRRGSCVRTTNGAIPKARAIGRETMAHTKRTSGAARTLLFAWRMLLCQKHRQQRCLSLRRSSRRRLQKQPQKNDASAASGSEDEPADSMVEKNTPRAGSAQSEPDDAATTVPAEPPSDQDSEDETAAAEGQEYSEEFSISSLIAQLVELKASETQLRPMELPLTSQVELASDLAPNVFLAQDSSAMKKEKKATPKADKPKVGKTAQDARAKHELEATMRAAQVTQMMQMRMYQAQAMQVQAMQYQAAYAQQARLAYAMQYQAACAAASGRC